MADLAEAGISMKEATDKLMVDGVKTLFRRFQNPVGCRQQNGRCARVSLETVRPTSYPAACRCGSASIDDWKKNNKVARLWQKDASLWTGTDESNWLGWLTITEEQFSPHRCPEADCRRREEGAFQARVASRHGGSSLCPEVLRMTFGKSKGFPELHVLDSTDPAQIMAIEAKVDLKSTVCIVSSKSGSTLETEYSTNSISLSASKAKVGEKEAGSRSSPSPTRARRCSKWQRRQIPQDFFSAFRASAAAIPRFPISAWFPLL